ncbi:Succinate dehydrogenase assembly factor 2, mitochondrial [Zancudomyces culisetae]|uniref:Succinate dehydrogenase assembly factor 2, mitochondrial n=1 Tax=Zancudomyces culisetae TaxID=1213189 RepID=A0A1R1PDL6_ZANCU|nr:Succinate dehydrogenase assembly factor 2, mitochondrial [Zancudomyces culisetae]|eukprot:OMH79095.1 Succinate dehydrogenase assembly factor 2, mitochondrial [Zancudomyces culisetae]
MSFRKIAIHKEKLAFSLNTRCYSLLSSPTTRYNTYNKLQQVTASRLVLAKNNNNAINGSTVILKSGFASSAGLGNKSENNAEEGEEDLDHKRRRLVWQTRRRGILESDLLLSSFAAQHIYKFNSEEVDLFAEFVNGNNDWDIYYWVVGSKVPPQDIATNPVFLKMVEYFKNNKALKSMPNTEEIVKE